MSYPEGLHHVEIGPLEDRCGIGGMISSKETPMFVDGFNILYKMQTRGYDAAGFAGVLRDGTILFHKDDGTIKEVFPPNIINRYREYKSVSAVFQTRYGTQGDSIGNAQPMIMRHADTNDLFMVAHNGQFSQKARYLNGKSDTAVFANELRHSEGKNWDEKIVNTLNEQDGAWSLIINVDPETKTPQVDEEQTDESAMYLCRNGVRPLYYSQRHDPATGAIITYAASETIALEQVGLTNFREVLPGQVLRFDAQSQIPVLVAQQTEKMHDPCMFENVYIEDEKSKVFVLRADPAEVNSAITVEEFRRRTGQIMAHEAPLTRDQIDIIVGIPGTAIAGGIAYAQELGLADLYEQIIEDRETSEEEQRTFMQSELETIISKVKGHFNFIGDIEGKRICLVDDSVVRSNVARGVEHMLRQLGATEVHMRVLCLPIDKGCHMGVNTGQENNLVIRWFTREVFKLNIPWDEKVALLIEKVRADIGLDSLAYISTEGLYEAAGSSNFCMGCMLGHGMPVDRFGKQVKHAMNSQKS